MRVTVLKEIPEDLSLCDAWNNLVLAMDNPEVFFTYQWALAASRSFQKHLTPLLFLMHSSDELAGVAALAFDPDSQEKAFFLTSSTADYCDIVSAPSDRKQVLDDLLQALHGLGITDLALANVPANSTTLKELPSVARSRQFYSTSRVSYNCGLIQLGGEGQRESVLHTIASKGRERRALKKLASLGSVKVTHLTEPGQVEAALQSIISAQISRFLASDRVSPLVGKERRTFLKELGDLLSQSGWLKISQLEIDGHAAAWNYGFRFGGSWFWYLPTFEMQYERVSPGSLLLRLLVEEAARDSSVHWLDLGLGDESYKERFANNVLQTRYVHLSRDLHRHAATAVRQMFSGLASRSNQVERTLRATKSFYRGATERLRQRGISAVAQESLRRAGRAVVSQDEVLLFEADKPKPPAKPMAPLLPITRDHLVSAAIANADNPETLRYLMRCARRLARSGSSGFVLLDAAGELVHFLWIDRFDGFHLSEIDHTIEPCIPEAAMIFDCWTPPAQRGRGHYAAALRSAAAALNREQRSAWIFSGASNHSSRRGIVKADFAYRFSFVRRTRLGSSLVTRQNATKVLATDTSTPLPDFAETPKAS